MDWVGIIIDQLGGGPSAVVIVGLAWAWWYERRGNNKMVNRILDMSQATTKAMNELRAAVERTHR